MWEQFISGSVDFNYFGGHTLTWSPSANMRNSDARHFGAWTDDILPNMTPGPRSIDSYFNAFCDNVGWRSASNRYATMNRPASDWHHNTSTYRFKDAPGKNWNFGDVINNMTFVGIDWNPRFEHKVWDAEGSLLYRLQFSVSGILKHDGTDTRRIN